MRPTIVPMLAAVLITATTCALAPAQVAKSWPYRNGEFLDDPRFDPIWERAQALDVPIYLHPAVPDSTVSDVYYKKYQQDFPMVIRAAWGFTVETATDPAMRADIVITIGRDTPDLEAPPLS